MSDKVFADEEKAQLKYFVERRWELIGPDFANYRDLCVLKMPAILAALEAAEKVAERFSALISIGMEAEEIAKLSKIELDQRFYRVMIARKDVEAWRKSRGLA